MTKRWVSRPGAAVAVGVLCSACVVQDEEPEFRWEDEIEDPSHGDLDPIDDGADEDAETMIVEIGCCDSFDCDDPGAGWNADACGADFTICNAIEDCCGMPVKECFPPASPSTCPPYDPGAHAADGVSYWKAHFREEVKLGPITIYDSDHWPLSTGVIGLAALGLESVAVVAAPVFVFADFVEAAQIHINNADDGFCECEYGAELRSKAWSQPNSPKRDVYCWRPTGDPQNPGAHTCQVEWGYTECKYEDAMTPVGKKAVLSTEQWLCDCGIDPGQRGAFVTDDGQYVYECASEFSNLCRCQSHGAIEAEFVTCQPDAQNTCSAQCSPHATDCRDKPEGDPLRCNLISHTPFE